MSNGSTFLIARTVLLRSLPSKAVVKPFFNFVVYRYFKVIATDQNINCVSNLTHVFIKLVVFLGYLSRVILGDTVWSNPGMMYSKMRYTKPLRNILQTKIIKYLIYYRHIEAFQTARLGCRFLCSCIADKQRTLWLYWNTLGRNLCVKDITESICDYLQKLNWYYCWECFINGER